ncbi:type IV pilus assembly protein PilM [Candidatus Saccharibacteria bacterium]|nr:type IV pilus assembly protein PilM [Candidatus Saccharibacteria bacterium]
MSKLFFQDKPIIGVDINQTGIKVMAVDTSHWTVTGYGSVELDPVEAQKSMEGDGEYLGENIRNLLKEKRIGKITTNHAVLSIPTSKTYARTFSVPNKEAGKLKDAIELEIEQYIPVPMAQLYVDHQILSRDKDNTTVQICAVPRNTVDTCVSAANSAGLDVVMVEPSVNAIARLLAFAEEGSLPTIIVDIGPAATDIAILDGTIRVSGGVAIGGNTFTLDIAKKLNVPLESAHQMKVQHGLAVSPRQEKIKSAIEPSLDRILREIKKIIRYYSERLNSEKRLEQVVIVGGGSNVPGLGDYFTNALMMPARVASPWQILNFGELEQPPKQFKARYITVAGLASVKPKEIF